MKNTETKTALVVRYIAAKIYSESGRDRNTETFRAELARLTAAYNALFV